MKKRFFPIIAALLPILAVSHPAVADEMWTTEEYDVTYHEDRNQTAIWHYGEDGAIFIDGLAGVTTDRGAYSGYWVQETSSVRCDTYREGADGEPTYHWGRFELTFVDSEFPSRWKADIGLCDRPPFITLNGTPITSP
jgi:hypothetical protein